MDSKTSSSDLDDLDLTADDATNEPARIKVGICAMNKKTYARPMKEILKRLKHFMLLEFDIFSDDVVLNEPVENWPVVDCLISFYSKGFPLEKAIAYANLRKPLVINDLEMQYQLQDRREVYRILEEEGLEIPRYAVFNRDDQGNPLSSTEDIEESDDTIIVNGKTFVKPFVEKPINAEDHNIYIYYPSSAGGGCQILFRKIGSRSSVYSSESRIRRTGSYIYEDFMPTDGTDVKVYTVGEEYAHAEARKSPVLDGKVERDSGGKEVRYPVILSAHEKSIAKRVCKAFKQTVCGFDLLRANGKSLVCDVNGFSFVKTSQKYYDDCSQLLGDIILQNLAPQLWIPPQIDSAKQMQSEEMPEETVPSSHLELRCVIAIIRHGDRTPKQKMKMVVTHKLFVELFNKYGGPDEGRLKIKKPKQLQEILDITRVLLESQQGDSLQPILENKTKLCQMKSVLEMYGHFSGINRKVQLKAMADKRNYDMLTKFKGRNKKSQTFVGTSLALLLILKWGGEVTPMGKKQAEDLGKAFRCVYPGGQGEYGRVPGFGFLRLHSTYRHDLKIYASDEGRVQMTAAAFAKGLLALEGELTPVLVSLVNSDKHATGMLDTPIDVAGTRQRVKGRLHEHLHSTEDFTADDEESLTRSQNTAILSAMREAKNPHQLCNKVYLLVQELVNLINDKCADPQTDPNEPILYHDESLSLMKHRWEKLEKDFWSGDEFDISLIPDIYDSVKYDYLHNRSLGLCNLPELYKYTKALADIVIPLEYGITVEDKLSISKQICKRFFRKIYADLQYSVHTNLEEAVHRLDPKESSNVASPHRHVRTRLYVTSESHVHSVAHALRYGSLSKDKDDAQWVNAIEYLNDLSEFNYLTQIVLMQYEDLSADPDSKERFRIEIFFSPGLKTPDNEQLANQLALESVGTNNRPFSLTELEALTLMEKARLEEMSAECDHVEKSRDRFDSGSSTGAYSPTPSPKYSFVSPVRMSLQPIVDRVNSNHLIKTPSAIKPVEELVNIHGADVIETLPSLHPLIRLHSGVSQFEMDRFLDEYTGALPTEEQIDMFTMSLKRSIDSFSCLPVKK